jgi:hypothetical protein
MHGAMGIALVIWGVIPAPFKRFLPSTTAELLRRVGNLLGGALEASDDDGRGEILPSRVFKGRRV